MDHTVTLSIGNTDDKLTQSEWSDYVKEFEKEARNLGHLQFYGFSSPDSPYQSCTIVLNVPEPFWRSRYMNTFDQWLDDVIIPSMVALRKEYRNDLIALTVGTTQFV